jgi:hypothetical protein
MKLTFAQTLASYEMRHMFLGGAQLHGFSETKELLKTYWLRSSGAIRHHTEEDGARIYGSLLDEIVESVLQDSNPGLALRRKLADSIYVLSRYEVLLIPMSPEPDPMGARMPRAGITGELGPYALAAYEACQELPNWELLEVKPQDTMDAVTKLLAAYFYWAAKVNTLWDLSKTFGLESEPMNWPHYALTAARSMWEHTYRELLDLPPALPDDIRESRYLKDVALLQLVKTGVTDPVAAWRALYVTGNDDGVLH